MRINQLTFSSDFDKCVNTILTRIKCQFVIQNKYNQDKQF